MKRSSPARPDEKPGVPRTDFVKRQNLRPVTPISFFHTFSNWSSACTDNDLAGLALAGRDLDGVARGAADPELSYHTYLGAVT